MCTKGKQFIEALKEKIYAEYNYSLASVYEGQCRKYTDVMSEIVTNLISDAGSKSYSEYFKIDYTGWTAIECEDVNGVHMYKWNHDFAIEHENDLTDWTYELLKLNFVRADVKVVIGYVDNESRDKEIDIIQSQVNQFKYPVDEDEEYYVVLMNKKLEEENPFGMRVYSIKNTEVEEVEI